MADISNYTQQIRQAVYGKDVRESIASGIEAINNQQNTYESELSGRQDDYEENLNIIETERVNNENIRKSNEDTRVEAENTRITNENTRTLEHTQQTTEVEAIKTAYDNATKANLSVEVSNARHDSFNNITYDNLQERLDADAQKIGNLSTLTTTDKTSVVNSINTIQSQMADIPNQAYIVEKAKQVDLDIANINLSNLQTTVTNNYATLDTKINSQASGSPKGIYATVSDLTTAYPSGNANIYLVTVDGGWYYWNGSTWTKGGTYQSTGIASKGVTQKELSDYAASKNLDVTKSAFAKGYNKCLNPVWEKGSLTNGVNNDSATTRARTQGYITEACRVEFDNTIYKINVTTYDSGLNYISNAWHYSSFDLPAGNYRMIIGYVDDRVMEESYVPTIANDVYVMTGKTFTLEKKVGIILGYEYPSIVVATKIFKLPADTVIVYNGTYYVLSSDAVIDCSGIESSAINIYFDITNSTFVPLSYNSALNKNMNYIKVTSIRFSTSRKAGCDIGVPYYIDGELFGLDYNTRLSALENGIDLDKIMINDLVKSINHRGYNTVAPENTIPAYKLSVKKGFKYVETDIAWTSDGIPVLLHDDTIDRTSDGTGSISSMTLAQVQTYDFGSWKSVDYAGTKIPTFDEFILFCKKTGLHSYLEIKSSYTMTTEMFNTLFAILDKYGMRNNVTWHSFNYSALQLLVSLDGTARIGYLTGATIDSTILTNLSSLKTANNDVFIETISTYATDSANTLVTDAGFYIEIYGTDSAATILNTFIYNVKGYLVDSLDVGKTLYDEAMS